MVSKQRLGSWFMIIGGVSVFLVFLLFTLNAWETAEFFEFVLFLFVIAELAAVVVVGGIKLRKVGDSRIRKWLWFSLIISIFSLTLTIFILYPAFLAFLNGSIYLSLIEKLLMAAFLVPSLLILLGSVLGLKCKTYTKIKKAQK